MLYVVSTVFFASFSYVQTSSLGHQQAWERAGILHRDVSIGNILIVDKPREGSFLGFIHDFDYSSVEEEDDEIPHLLMTCLWTMPTTMLTKLPLYRKSGP